MVAKVAPYLTVDGDPYPFVDKETGHIVWMVDAYTTMDNYPYSQRKLAFRAHHGLAVADRRTASQPNSEINYIRNSVKATVDAYTGKVTLYRGTGDEPGPGAAGVEKRIFPGTVQQTMPQIDRGARAVPAGSVRGAARAARHVPRDDPVTFYNVRRQVDGAERPEPKTTVQPPYYVVASKPMDQTVRAAVPADHTDEGQQRTNLAAYITVDSDPGADYGKMTVLRVPTNAATRGRSRSATIQLQHDDLDGHLAAQQGGSLVLHGNLLTLPIGNSFLYVEPLYVAGHGDQRNTRCCKRVWSCTGMGRRSARAEFPTH